MRPPAPSEGTFPPPELGEPEGGLGEPEGGFQTFWDHLDALRNTLLRMLAAAGVAAVGAFVLKEPLFRMVLAPAHADFCTYRLLRAEPFEIALINTQLTEPFAIHLRVAVAAGLFIASPYLLYALYSFVAPALYEREKAVGIPLLVAAYLMALLGLAANYLLFFPLTLRFLSQYSVSEDVANLLSLTSYVDTLLLMSLLFALLFEMPVVAWLLGRGGLLRKEWMSRYRRHAIVVILIACALITPTTDALTLIIVALPVWALYELSILIVSQMRNEE